MSATSPLPAWRRWFKIEPFRHERWEIWIMRLLLALLIWDTQTGWIAYWQEPLKALEAVFFNAHEFNVHLSSQPHPNGLAMFFDLTFLAKDSWEFPLRDITGVCLVLWVLGVSSAWTLAIPTLFCIGISTLNNSQGSIGHSAQPVHLCLLAIWMAGLWAAWQTRRGRPLSYGYNRSQLEMHWARSAFCSVYVVSALTKLWVSRGLWFLGAKYFPLGMLKNTEMEFYDSLNAAARDREWLPDFLMNHPHWCQFLFGIALPLEMFFFFGLNNRRLAALFGIALIGFHESVTQLTFLSFIFNKLFLLILFVSPWWWLIHGFKKPRSA